MKPLIGVNLGFKKGSLAICPFHGVDPGFSRGGRFFKKEIGNLSNSFSKTTKLISIALQKQHNERPFLKDFRGASKFLEKKVKMPILEYFGKFVQKL